MISTFDVDSMPSEALLWQSGYLTFTGSRRLGARLEFEFKVVELAPDGRALQQIKDRGYADKYRALGQPIHQIGIEFSRERRALVGFEVETL